MDEVGICMVVYNNYFATRYTIENLFCKTNLKARLYIVDNGSTDSEVSNWCMNYCSKNGGYYKRIEKTEKYSKAINEIIRIVTQDYMIIFPVNALVSSNWAEDLIHYQKLIPSTGITSIRFGHENLHWMPLLHMCDSMPEDELKNVLITENNSVEGIMCFKTEQLMKIGYFDENLQHPGFEQPEFCFRMASLGLNNIYIRKQTAVRLSLSDDILFPKKTKEGMDEFKSQVEWMIKNQMFKK